MIRDFIKGKSQEIRLLRKEPLGRLNNIKNKAYYCYDVPEWDKKSPDDPILYDKLIPYRISTIKHGFSGFIFEKNDTKYVAFTLHTSKPNFKLFDLTFTNIEIKEQLNPIKFANPMHFMKLDTFKQVFTLESPHKLFTRTIFENVEMHDAAYCAFRAAIKSTTQSDHSLWSIVSNTAQYDVVNSTFVTDNDKILTPAQILSKTLDVNFEEDFKEGFEYMSEISNDNWGKEGLIITAQNVYEDNF